MGKPFEVFLRFSQQETDSHLNSEVYLTTGTAEFLFRYSPVLLQNFYLFFCVSFEVHKKISMFSQIMALLFMTWQACLGPSQIFVMMVYAKIIKSVFKKRSSQMFDMSLNCLCIVHYLFILIFCSLNFNFYLPTIYKYQNVTFSGISRNIAIEDACPFLQKLSCCHCRSDMFKLFEGFLPFFP